MIEVRTLVSHAEDDHSVTKIAVEIWPLPDDSDLHAAISAVCMKAVAELLGCQAVRPSEMN